jgi:hypothetical protein
MTERSDSPTRNGLAQIFSKTRNRDKKGRDSAGNSIKSTDDSLGLRGSVEDAIEKMRGSTSTEDDGESNGIKKLVPKGIGSKRRQKKKEKEKEKEEEEEEQRASEEAARGRSVADRGTLRNDGSSPPVNGSGDGSSLITYDSDTES